MLEIIKKKKEEKHFKAFKIESFEHSENILKFQFHTIMGKLEKRS